MVAPLANTSAAVFHAYCATVSLCWVLRSLCLLRPRRGAPSFYKTVATGVDGVLPRANTVEIGGIYDLY